MTMKYVLGTLAVLALAAAATGFVCYRMSLDPALHTAARQGDPMEWLRADFHLSGEQFTAIKNLHDAYAPSCEEHCRLIQEATRLRDAIKGAGHGDAAAMAAAEGRILELRASCETAIARHVRQVAAEMSPADGQRYLALILPRIANFDHTAAPSLRLNDVH